MNKKLNSFFEAINNRNFRYISTEWISILTELFPLSLFDLEGYQSFQKFYQQIDRFIQSSHYKSIDNFLSSEDYPLYLDPVQKTALKRIYRLIPEVLSSLKPTYTVSVNPFFTDHHTLKNRLLNKKVKELKSWIDNFNHPMKLYDTLSGKSRFSSDEYDLIAELTIRDKYDILLKTVYSTSKSLRNKQSALKAMFLIDDEELHYHIKSITLSEKVDSSLRMEAVRFILLKNEGEMDYWQYLSQIPELSAIHPLIEYKILALRKESRFLYEELKNKALAPDAEEILVHLIRHSSPRITTMKGLFKLILDTGSKRTVKERKLKTALSDTIREIFIEYFTESPLKVRSFSTIFISMFQLLPKATKESFSNFTGLLMELLRKEELEYIINDYLNQIKSRISREDTVEKLSSFFHQYQCGYNRQTGKLLLSRI